MADYLNVFLAVYEMQISFLPKDDFKCSANIVVVFSSEIFRELSGLSVIVVKNNVL